MSLKLAGICKTFCLPGQRVHALRDVSLSAGQEEFITVIGSNGAGKSTLLDIVAGVRHPDKGRVWIAGRDVTSRAAHRRARWVGRVFQDPLKGTVPELTVEENLALCCRRGRRGLSFAVNRRRRRLWEDALARLDMGLERRRRELSGLLSGGERQALTVLMATLARPTILLLDEHTAALDPANAERVLAITEELVHEGGMTTLMVTHRMDQALSVGERLIMLHAGEVLLEVSGEDKRSLEVAELVRLFRRRGVTDDALLLEAHKGCPSASDRTPAR